MLCCNLVIIPGTSKIPPLYCREMEISVTEGEQNTRHGAWRRKEEVANRGRKLTGESVHIPRMFWAKQGIFAIALLSKEGPMLCGSPQSFCLAALNCLSILGEGAVLVWYSRVIDKNRIENISLFSVYLHSASKSRMVCSSSGNKGTTCLGVLTCSMRPSILFPSFYFIPFPWPFLSLSCSTLASG